MALDSEVCRQDRVQQDRARLDGVVEDITKDHGLKGAEKERAEEYTRKVTLSGLPPVRLETYMMEAR